MSSCVFGSGLHASSDDVGNSEGVDFCKPITSDAYLVLSMLAKASEAVRAWCCYMTSSELTPSRGTCRAACIDGTNPRTPAVCGGCRSGAVLVSLQPPNSPTTSPPTSGVRAQPQPRVPL